MLQVTRGEQFPLVSVRTRLPVTASTSKDIEADLDIELAGQTAHYEHVAFTEAVQRDETHITWTIPLRLSDFKIDPPTLLSLAVKNEVPVLVDMTWHQEK
jgi:hypothetical protein